MVNEICIHFNPNESPKLVESLRLLTLQTEKLIFLYCFDLFSSLMSCKIFFWGIYLILIKPMFISKMVLFAFVISQFFILSDEALMNSNLLIYKLLKKHTLYQENQRCI